MVAISEARIDMADSPRIIKRLTNHWRHKFEIEQQQDHSIIHFSEHTKAILTGFDDHLWAKVEVSTEEELARYEDVILRHINSMAHQEFEANWIRVNNS